MSAVSGATDLSQNDETVQEAVLWQQRSPPPPATARRTPAKAIAKGDPGATLSSRVYAVQVGRTSVDIIPSYWSRASSLSPRRLAADRGGGGGRCASNMMHACPPASTCVDITAFCPVDGSSVSSTAFRQLVVCDRGVAVVKQQTHREREREREIESVELQLFALPVISLRRSRHEVDVSSEVDHVSITYVQPILLSIVCRNAECATRNAHSGSRQA